MQVNLFLWIVVTEKGCVLGELNEFGSGSVA
jgi:hypothetical protein